MMTRQALESRLEDAGCPWHAASMISQLWSSERHLWRSQATIDAAPGSSDPEKAFWILADALGVGGKEDIAGVTTIRHPAFRSLGKGRWHASDGAAWHAAACQAYITLTGGWISIEPSPDLGFIAVSTHRGETATFPLPHHWEGEEFRWARAMVLRACAIVASKSLNINLPNIIKKSLERLPLLIELRFDVGGSLALWARCLEHLAYSEKGDLDEEDL